MAITNQQTNNRPGMVPVRLPSGRIIYLPANAERREDPDPNAGRPSAWEQIGYGAGGALVGAAATQLGQDAYQSAANALGYGNNTAVGMDATVNGVSSMPSSTGMDFSSSPTYTADNAPWMANSATNTTNAATAANTASTANTANAGVSGVGPVADGAQYGQMLDSGSSGYSSAASAMNTGSTANTASTVGSNIGPVADGGQYAESLNTMNTGSNAAEAANTASSASQGATTSEMIGGAIPAAVTVGLAGYNAYNELSTDRAGRPASRGAASGAMSGAAIGGRFYPGIGHIVGAIIGGIVGGIHSATGSRKGEQQLRRDAMRDALGKVGFVHGTKGDADVSKGAFLTLADGSKWDMGGDTRGANLQNMDGGTRNEFEVDSSDPVAPSVVGLLDPLAEALIGGDEQLRVSLSGYMTNAAMSQEDIVSNVKQFYRDGVEAMLQKGDVSDEAAHSFMNGQVQEMHRAGVIDEARRDAYLVSLDRLYNSDDPMTVQGQEAIQDDVKQRLYAHRGDPSADAQKFENTREQELEESRQQKLKKKAAYQEALDAMSGDYYYA